MTDNHHLAKSAPEATVQNLNINLILVKCNGVASDCRYLTIQCTISITFTFKSNLSRKYSRLWPWRFTTQTHTHTHSNIPYTHHITPQWFEM